MSKLLMRSKALPSVFYRPMDRSRGRGGFDNVCRYFLLLHTQVVTSRHRRGRCLQGVLGLRMKAANA
jgi:hypothetical protein